MPLINRSNRSNASANRPRGIQGMQHSDSVWRGARASQQVWSYIGLADLRPTACDWQAVVGPRRNRWALGCDCTACEPCGKAHSLRWPLDDGPLILKKKKQTEVTFLVSEHREKKENASISHVPDFFIFKKKTRSFYCFLRL